MKLSNKEFVFKWFENQFPFEDLDPEIVVEIPGANGGKFVGTEQLGQFLGNLAQKVNQIFNIKKQDCVAEDDKVVIIVEEAMIPKNDPSKQYLNRSAWFFKLNSLQKIVYIYTYDDTSVVDQVLSI